MKKIVAAVVIFFVLVGLAYADKRGTAEEAKAMLDKAVAFYKANGQEKALAAFNDPKGPFVQGDLYIFALGLDGKILAHAIKPKLVGKGQMEIRDADENNFIKQMVDVAKSKGSGVIEYKWENPVSLVVEKKSAYIEKVDEMILGCGYFKAYGWQPLAYPPGS